MADATSKLNILISAQNQASATLNQVKSDASGLKDVLAGVGAAFGVSLGVEGVKQLAEMGVEMARTGADAQELGAAFNTLAEQAGQSGDAMLAAMKQASQGTISNSELMLAANTAFTLGAAKNTKDLTDLMEVAAVRADTMGVSTAEAFNLLTEGIGRKSDRQLKSLGIDVDAAAANEVYAQSIGTTSQNLDEQQQKTALLNAVLRDSAALVRASGGAARSSADDFEAYDAAVTNAKEALGEVFAPSVAAGARVLTTYLDGQVTMLNNEINALNSAYVATKNFTTGSHDLSLAQREAAAAIDQAAVAEGHADAITHNLTFGLNGLGAAAVDVGGKMLAMGADALAAMEQFNQLLSVNSQIASAAAGAGVLFGAKVGGDAGLAKQKAVSAELQAQNQTWLDMHYTQKQIDDVLMPAYIQNLNAADQATFATATHTAGISSAASAASQAFDDLKSKVSGVLSGALDPGVGVDPASLLPRPDAINEDARRLADVAVNGWASPWADYFQKEFPDLFAKMTAGGDIKTAAAQMLQDFQDGLEPELLDKEKVKERVRRMILGEQNMADLAQEIASELSTEMGVPLQTALAAAQGTVGGGTGMGNQVATQFSDGATAALDDTGGGGNFVNKFIDQAKAQYPLLSTAGKDAGKLWGAGFLETVGANVPPALIKILTDLVTPGVMAAMNQKATLTGATP